MQNILFKVKTEPSLTVTVSLNFIMGCCGSKEPSSHSSVPQGKVGVDNQNQSHKRSHQDAPGDEDAPVMVDQDPASPAEIGFESLDEDFKARIATAAPDTLILIRFFKGDCNQCVDIGLFYQSLVPQYPDVVFLDANIARNNHAIGAMSIDAVPTFIAFKDHREVGRYTGTDPNALQSLVASNYTQPPLCEDEKARGT